MDPQIQEIKEKTDLAALIGERVKLSRAGRNLKGICPFHGEQTPSFMVSPERGTWRCFGCGKHGDAITFLEEYEHLPFGEALEQLAQKVGITLQKVHRSDAAVEVKNRLFDMLNLANEYYHFILTKHELGEQGRVYIKERQIASQTVTKFSLGYAPNSWQSLTEFLSKKGYKPHELAQVGLTSEGNGGRNYDRFRGRLMFPVYDTMGRVVGFSGRSLIDNDKGPKYLNSPDSDLFHKGRLLYGLHQAKEAIRLNNRLVLVEGNIDVLSSVQAGVSEVVAPLGTAFTPEQAALIKRFTQNVAIAFDADKAGQEATRRAIEILRQNNLDTKVVLIPGGKDPDDAIKENSASWKKAVTEAKDVFDYYLQWTSTTFNVATEQGRRQAVNEVLPLLRATSDPISRAFLIQKVANALMVDEETLLQALEQAPERLSSVPNEDRPERQPKAPPRRLAPQSRNQVLSTYLLSTILGLPVEDADGPRIAAILKATKVEALPDLYKSTYLAILRAIEGQSVLRLQKVQEYLELDDLEVFDTLSLTDTGKMTGTGQLNQDTLEALQGVVRELNELYVKNQLNHLGRSLKQAEALGQETLQLRTEFAQVTQELAQLEKKNEAL